MDEKTLDGTISRYDSPSGRLLGILEEIQNEERYIPRESLEQLSEKLDVPLSQLYSLVTFYSFFSLVPVGDHRITVCMGTACHVKGAAEILTTLESLLGFPEGITEEKRDPVTTEDNAFTLEIARCFGACSIAPVLRVDNTLYGYAKAGDLPGILEEYGWER
jgi:NADH:ubiquinone oxidoreductase subunit E